MTGPGPLRCFLFTDIEGSTARWELDVVAMDAALEGHDAIVRGAISAHGGTVFSTAGDGFGAVFDGVDGGVAAALQAQAQLSEGTIRVRMGVHVGPAFERGGDYFGPTPNRAARLMAAGHGGQVLLSEAVAALVRQSIPDGVVMVDLGVHQLRDLQQPERVWQLVFADRPSPFPPLRTVDVVASNLPGNADQLVGRAGDMAQVIELLRRERVVTITGPGGVGKTRLALAVAATMLSEFSGGCWIVELDSVGDASGLVGATASVLPLRGTVRTADDLIVQLRPLQMLLVLDNCEHVVDRVADLLAAVAASCPEITVLCTSREALTIGVEHLWPLLPLSLEDAEHLFVERAHSVRPDLVLEREAVIEISRRLDCLPLAIELAAARVSTFTPSEIASMLDDRFRLLSGGRRSSQPRHRTLQAMVDWSHDSLDDAERALFRSLGIFAGGFTIDAVRAVCASVDPTAREQPEHLQPSVLDVLHSLVQRSVVVAEPAGLTSRFRMLETLRQYALDRLDEAGETVTIARRHAEWCAELAEEIEQGVWSPDEAAWLARARSEFSNLRAAMSFVLTERNLDLAVRIAGGLHRISHLQWIEPMEWARRVLTLAGADAHPTIGKVHLTIGRLSWMVGDLDRSEQACEEALRHALDEDGAVLATLTLGVVAAWRGRGDDALDRMASLLDRPLSPRNRSFARVCLLTLPGGLLRVGDEPQVVIREADDVGVPFIRALARTAMGVVEMSADRDAEALDWFGASIEIGLASGNTFAVRGARTFADIVSSRLHSPQDAGPDEVALRAGSSLDLRDEFAIGFVGSLIGLAFAVRSAGSPADAAVVAGFLEGHPSELGVSTRTMEFLCGHRIAEFVAPDAVADFHRGQMMSSDELAEFLHGLAAPR